jgi:hypothetical protein
MNLFPASVTLKCEPLSSTPIASAADLVRRRPAFRFSSDDDPPNPFSNLSLVGIFPIYHVCDLCPPQILDSPNKSTEFWWHTTGVPFAKMLHRASYPLEKQYSYLIFYYLFIVPEFGPAPTLPIMPRDLACPANSLHSVHVELQNGATSTLSPCSSPTFTSVSKTLPELVPYFPSYMTDDHSPLELSWLFDSKGGAVVRFSIDPVRRQLDNQGPMDFFEDLAGRNVLARGVDLEWCRVCAESLTTTGTTQAMVTTTNSLPEYLSQYFVGE